MSDNEDNGMAREQDRFLPIANISRIMKKALPNNAKIAKDAKETVQECVSEFISFITSEASDKCQREKRKTINGDDLLWAMTTLGFEDYIEPLKLYLQKFRQSEANMGKPEGGKKEGGGAPGAGGSGTHQQSMPMPGYPPQGGMPPGMMPPGMMGMGQGMPMQFPPPGGHQHAPK
mmetsp:Transcript_6718/g.16712  ORF Transcript_6718/g.16712 Transcript_6718/m.16712 type:complete len:175 (-) Transcript_6718:833-1357(-)|eukprot:CAMPEP_0202857718 /NCGR_PEP_ID=MMETSP1391-20130828/548_1 /ASSEMBLY_ACC=CAM_ASM_000867 /TAXON_ID=1034604 /ORGANISM="Chlamydomonas leiostraca, Strain SAG 11-49" /LENGTH=174 /DNA_ID=CAMNT_0049536557 /DNA_START=100 /DNA_END=624 /DNA_ORIENTATION=-